MINLKLGVHIVKALYIYVYIDIPGVAVRNSPVPSLRRTDLSSLAICTPANYRSLFSGLGTIAVIIQAEHDARSRRYCARKISRESQTIREERGTYVTKFGQLVPAE